MDSGQPPARCGNVFAAVHGGKAYPGSANDNNLYELYKFSVTLTMRVAVPPDRVGDQVIARNLHLVPLAQRQGFNAKVEQLRAFLHMNWNIVVIQEQEPNSANDNLIEWCDGTVYGFCEPMRYMGAEVPVLVGGEWMSAKPNATDFALKSELQFDGVKRFQPQTAASGPFV